MRISIHQQAALIWLFSSTVVLSPIIHLSPKPSAGFLLWIGIATVTVMIAIVPLFLKWESFRKTFCWTDALSTKERKLLSERRAGDFYQAAYDDGYVMRLKPYLILVGIVAICWAILPELILLKFENDVLQSVYIFSSWYVSGVFILMAATVPFPQILRSKFLQKR